jgi:hypothetical protein
MRTSHVLLAAAALSLSAGLALADPTAPPAAQEPPTDVSEAVVEAPQPDPDPEICRREKPTGSSIGVKVCRKKSEWVAKSTRGPRVGEPVHVDGQDYNNAPLPPSN